MSVKVRAISEAELPAFEAAVLAGFLDDSPPGHLEAFAEIEDLSRARCGFDGDELVATLGAFPFELAVPGATLATAGTTHITVRPTHRRRGLLNELMRQHFDDLCDREEPLAALWASEAGIYRRFGYGAAADTMRIVVERTHSAFLQELDAPGSVRLIGAEEAATLLPQIYEALWRKRPGHFSRSRAWWDNRQLLDAPSQREGLSANRFAIYEENGTAQGYAQYRVRQRWSSAGIPDSDLRIVELQAPPAARAALWRLLLDVDLVGSVTYWNDAVDSELPWLLADSRRAVRSIRDALWLRLVNVPRALEARSYAVEGRIRIGVRDAHCPENQGTHELEAGPSGAKCRPSTAEADIELDVSELGSAYLGTHSLFELARAGRVRGEAAAIEAADRMFHSPIKAWCPEIF